MVGGYRVLEVEGPCYCCRPQKGVRGPCHHRGGFEWWRVGDYQDGRVPEGGGTAFAGLWAKEGEVCFTKAEES